MSVAPAEPTTPEPTEPPVATATPPAPAPAEPPKAAEPAATGGDDTPNVIKALRDDFKAERARRQAAETSQQAYLEAMGKALGYTPESAPQDPVQLGQELEAERTAAKNARVELAVFKASGAAGGDPLQLLDSESFKRSLDAIDPADTAAVQAAIASAVAANPRLGAAPGDPKTPAPNPAQGSSASGAPGLDDQIDAATKAGDFQTAIALKQQRAAALRTKP